MATVHGMGRRIAARPSPETGLLACAIMETTLARAMAARKAAALEYRGEAIRQTARRSAAASPFSCLLRTLPNNAATAARS